MGRPLTQPLTSTGAVDQTLQARLDALWPDVVRPLRGLYGGRPDFDSLLARLRDQAVAAYAERSADLHGLDDRRLVTPDWFQPVSYTHLTLPTKA